MVFKFTSLARQSISKHLVNGYAQSVVAATQSSYASSTLPIHRLQSNTPAKIQHAFGGAHNGRTAPSKDGSGSDTLSSFYAVPSQDDKEDRKYLFSRKILWSKAQHQKQQKQLLGQPQPIAETDYTKSRSSSFASVVEEVDEAAQVREALKQSEEASSSAAREATVVEEEAAIDGEEVAADKKESSAEDSLVATPEVPSVTTQYNAQLESLCDEGRYHEVAAIFRHMVSEGVQPNTASYNALLTSIVKLEPRFIPEVLDVYKAMLREKLTPNTVTYTVLIEFLASRAIRTQAIVRNIEKDAERFGVMLPSKSAIVDELQKEDTLHLALDLFYASTHIRTDRTFPDYVYSALIQACSKAGREDDMLNICIHMESHGIHPTPEVVRSMIRGFGRTGNIRCAVEAYNSWQESEIARDPLKMDERYQIYRDLIKAYMDVGDSVGALTFLEKVVEVSRESARIEWLTQAVVKGFIQDGDVQAAKRWASQLSLKLTHTKWLAKMMGKVADKGELEFARALYNTFDTANATESQLQTLRFVLAQCQMSGLALCIREKNVDLARALWKDLNNRELSAGPNLTTAVSYTSLLFEMGLVNEALVVMNQYSAFFMERYTPSALETLDPLVGSEAKRLALQEAYEYTIVNLSAKGILNPSIALDIAGFSLARCGDMGAEASRRVLSQFDTTRILGLEPSQLSLVLQLQVGTMHGQQRHGDAPLAEDIQTFELMLSCAMKAALPVIGPVGEGLARGVAIVSQVKPDITARWESCVQQQLTPPPPPPPAPPQVALPPTPVSLQASPIEVSPSLGPSDAAADEAYDPYWAKTDVCTSDAIDISLDRNKYNKIADLRRMYRNSRRSGKALRLTTLAKIVSATARTGSYEDFLEEIYRNAKLDTPYLAEYPTSRFGWCVLLDSLVAAQLNLGHREKAEQYHNEMLQDFGASPSANTFGLYIVSLKGSKTHDEASEAVRIFDRARAENVLPSSFLYNALIGKLAKARRVDDCLFYFAEMRALNIKPTSVTYGTMINALTRVGDETFAEELFAEMESVPNYKPRPAPYNSLMQFFITTKRDRSKVLAYYQRMLSLGIQPTAHTYKLLIEAYATLDPPDMQAAESVLSNIPEIESSHHAALIHAKGCVLHDVPAAIAHFNSVMDSGVVFPDSTLYQALLEGLVANHRVAETMRWVKDMESRGISVTPYIANTLIHGWAHEKDMQRAWEIYNKLDRREPSTYEAMVRACLAAGDSSGARRVADEMKGRGYPGAVVARVGELVRGI